MRHRECADVGVSGRVGGLGRRCVVINHVDEDLCAVYEPCFAAGLFDQLEQVG